MITVTVTCTGADVLRAELTPRRGGPPLAGERLGSQTRKCPCGGHTRPSPRCLAGELRRAVPFSLRAEREAFGVGTVSGSRLALCTCCSADIEALKKMTGPDGRRSPEVLPTE